MQKFTVANQQQNAGKVYIQFLLDAVITHGKLPTGTPVPVKFKTEDAWNFELTSDRATYEAGGDAVIEVKIILNLMLMSEKERQNALFPGFTIKDEDWKVLKPDSVN